MYQRVRREEAHIMHEFEQRSWMRDGFVGPEPYMRGIQTVDAVHTVLSSEF